MQSRAAIAQRVGVIRSQCQRAVVARQRFVASLQRMQCIAAIVEGDDIIGVSFQCAIYLLDSRGRVTTLEKNDA